MKKHIQPVKGTRDFYPEDMALRNWLYQAIKRVSEAYGYQEYEGPMLEPLELYAAKSGEEIVKEQSFVFPDRKGSLITLRPELTPSLARLVAQRQNQLHFPIRWWSYGPMWRYEQPQAGRTREFFQWNIDLVGVASPEADAELVAIGASLLKEVGLSPSQTKILVNNRRLMDGNLEALNIPPAERPKVFRLIDRKEKMKIEAWKAYAADLGLNQQQISSLLELMADESLWKKSTELTRFFQALEALGVQDYVRYSPDTIRGLDYYTGTVFECFDTQRKFRSIFAGGRYDNLVADVGGNPLPGVGFAMGDKVIIRVLESEGILPDTSSFSQTDVLVTVFDEEYLLDSYALAAELRQTGFRISCYPVPAKLSKQLKYASRTAVRIAVVLGPDEKAAGQVTVRDLNRRTQERVARDQAGVVIRKILESPDSS